MTYEELYQFIKTVDTAFPIPLSDKVNLSDFTDKLLTKATIYAEYKDGEIISLVAGYDNNIENDIAYITIVATKKEAQRNGYAKMLINLFFEGCKKRNIKGVHLYTHITNKSAVKMYKDIGFVDYIIEDEPRPDDVHLVYWIEE